MKSYAKKIMTRLAAGAMALLLAVGTAATDMSVYAAETKTQEGTTEKKKITGFADLSDNPKEIRMTGKISLNRLLGCRRALMFIWMAAKRQRVFR